MVLGKVCLLLGIFCKRVHDYTNLQSRQNTKPTTRYDSSSSGSCAPSALPLRQKSDSESSEGSCEGVDSLDKLLTMFCGKLSAKRVCAVYHAFKDDFHASVEFGES